MSKKHHRDEEGTLMKTRTQLAGYLGLLGLTTLIAILYAVRDKLIAIAPWVLAVLLALAGMAVAYLLYKLYASFHSVAHGIRARRHELRAREQQLAIEAERWQIERSALLLAQQHLATRIYPDAKGYMPTLVSIEESGYNYIQLPHPAHVTRTSRSEQPAISEHAESRASSIPESVRYEDIRSHVPAGHALLGVSEQGVETKEFSAFKTMLISGGSDSGKSNTVALKIDEAIRLGRNIKLIVIDWHAYKPDSLTNKIKGYTSRFLMPVVTEEDETVGVLEYFLGLYQERRAAMKEAALKGQELSFDDILLVADEVPEMLDSGIPELKETLKQVAKICGRSARGFGLFGWFICQNMIGVSSIRSYAHTIIGHKPVMLNERKMVANGHTEIAADMEFWPKGRVVVYGQSFTGTQVTQMPLFDVASQPATTRVVEADSDEMEPLQPRQSFFSEHEEILPANVRPFPKNSLNAPTEQADTVSSERTEPAKVYRLSEDEIKAFIAAFKASGSRERALSAIGRGSRYRQHAEEVIAAYGLRKDA